MWLFILTVYKLCIAIEMMVNHRIGYRKDLEG